MSQQKLKAAILVISTTASKDPSRDFSGSVLQGVFNAEGAGKWEITEPTIVRDDVLDIQRGIMSLTDGEGAVNLVVTTGGTGFAVQDNTPEAIAPLLHKHAPGLVHGMLAASFAITPFALMSRPVAGVRHKTVIVTLPGSPKGAKENLESLVKLLPHACVQAAGADSRGLHAGGVEKLEQEAGIGANLVGLKMHKHSHNHIQSHSHDHDHSHGHGHAIPVRHTNFDENPQSNDPSLGPSQRSRKSPYPMLEVEDALQLIYRYTPKPRIINTNVDGNLVGSVLAEDVAAPEAVPAFRASIVDGYAVIVPEQGGFTKGLYRVSSVSHAAPHEPPSLQVGHIARITTGAPLPLGANAVVMVEDTVLKTQTDDGMEEKDVQILAGTVKAGENVREIGSDVKKGAIILRKGEEISATGGELGLLVSVGKAKVQIYQRPVVGVLSTGDEIVEHNKAGSLRMGEVRDTNRPTILSAIRSHGYQAVDFGIASDEPGILEEKLRNCLKTVDVLITTGGVSMGELDLLKPTIERSLGGSIHFGRVSMKPGKPTTFATVPIKSNAGERFEKVIFSLPGNPVSAIVTFNLFVLPSLHLASGVSPPGLPKILVIINHDFRLDPQRAEYHRVVVTLEKDGRMHAASTGGQRSSTVGSLKSANALLCLPIGKETLKKGSQVAALLMGRLKSELDSF